MINMKELAMIPIIFSIILGISIELIDVAESSSAKVIRYTEAMEKGIDCAFRGELILECSPELNSIRFDSDLDKFDNTLKEIKEELSNISNNLGLEINLDNLRNFEFISYDIDDLEDLENTDFESQYNLNHTEKIMELFQEMIEYVETTA